MIGVSVNRNQYWPYIHAQGETESPHEKYITLYSYTRLRVEVLALKNAQHDLLSKYSLGMLMIISMLGIKSFYGNLI